MFQFYRSIRSFDATGFDLVITDFEPISSRVARRNNLTCINIGHQYAFCHDIPTGGDTFLTRWIINNFAKTDIPLGLHWHHFNQPIFPGITKRWHWPFPDPAAVVGTDTEKLEQVRKIRDMIKDWMLNPPDNTANFKEFTEK